MTDPNDLRKVETWLRDCKADLWMAECCEDAADDIERLTKEMAVGESLEAGYIETVARLRLTDAELEAIEWCLSLPMLHRDVVRMMPLRSILERMR